jgi:hypothetical protein
MTENQKENTSKTVDDSRKAATAVHGDVKNNSHAMHKDADVKTHAAASHEKTGSHKDMSADPKSGIHTMHKDVAAEVKADTHTMHKDADVKGQNIAGHDKSDSHKDVPVDPKLAARNKIEFYAQMSGGLAGAKFPIKTAADLLSAFPKGAATAYHVGNLRMTAGEAGNLLKPADFPFTSAKAVVDVIAHRAGL